MKLSDFHINAPIHVGFLNLIYPVAISTVSSISTISPSYLHCFFAILRFISAFMESFHLSALSISIPTPIYDRYRIQQRRVLPSPDLLPSMDVRIAQIKPANMRWEDGS